MAEFRALNVTVDTGVEGDFRRKLGHRQVTVLSEEAWKVACANLKIDLPWTTQRANLLVSDITFSPGSVGRVLEIGEVILEITMETAPCDRMEKAHTGLREALTPNWMGGVSCRVILGGLISVGDTFQLRDY